MLHLLSILTTLALMVLQSGLAATVQLDRANADLDNSLQPNVIPSTPRRRLRKFVHISQPPPETAKHALGTRLELDCEVMGSPAPSVQWMKNGEPLLEYEEETNEILSAHPSSLARLTSTLIVSTPSANGEDVYTCVASAGLKTDTASTTVFTERNIDSDDILSLRKLLAAPSKPRITTYYGELFQEMGTNVLLPCNVYSHPKSQIIWQDSDENVVNFSGNSRMRVLQSGALLINNLRWSDMGQYRCSVKNIYGKAFIETFVYPVKP